MQLACAMLFVKDLERMCSFYGSLLGLKPIAETRTDGWAEFAVGPVRLGLHAIPKEIADTIEITSPPAVREETPIKLIFAVEDLNAEYVRLMALGMDLRRRPWGACDGVDPEGNVFQIAGAGGTT